MLYLRVSGSLVVGYQRIAEQQKISLSKLLRQVLYQGLRRFQRKRTVQKEERQQFIRDHWEMMSDKEMATKLSLSTGHLKALRQKLGLLRLPKTKTGGVLLRDNGEWLKQQLTEEGLTLDEVGQIVHLTREGVRQIAVNMGISGEEKTPLWHVRRLAKKYGQPQLANPQWLQEQLEKKSLTTLVDELSISPYVLQRVLGRLNIKYQRPVSYQTIQTNCVSCGKPLIKKIYPRNRDQRLFFCNRVCLGKNMARKGASTRHQKAQEKDQFIREHWEMMSDKEMATKLSSSTQMIAKRRRKLRLLRPKRRPVPSENSRD